jgi:hypothetical protein
MGAEVLIKGTGLGNSPGQVTVNSTQPLGNYSIHVNPLAPPGTMTMYLLQSPASARVDAWTFMVGGTPTSAETQSLAACLSVCLRIR